VGDVKKFLGLPSKMATVKRGFSMAKKVNTVKTTSGKLAEVLGISERTVRDMASRNILVRLETGYYDLGESVKNYIKHLGQKNSQGDKELKELQKKKLQIQIDEMEGRLISTVEVDDFYQKLIAVTRSRLLTIPKKIAPTLKHLTDEDSIELELKNEIYEALEELSRADSDTDD
jgi:phage terminase Nu1 subunit (DNA packaging protein)